MLGLGAVLLVACSSFEKDTSDADGGADTGAPDGGSDGARYDPRGDIACEGTVCHPPQFCCQRQSETSTCETTGCTAGEEARERCSDGRSCQSGFVCCMRLADFHVESIECEKDCATARSGGTGAFQLCGDGDANGVCPGACLAIQQLLGAKPIPDLAVRACQ